MRRWGYLRMGRLHTEEELSVTKLPDGLNVLKSSCFQHVVKGNVRVLWTLLGIQGAKNVFDMM